jgi:hypothetical protein
LRVSRLICQNLKCSPLSPLRPINNKQKDTVIQQTHLISPNKLLPGHQGAHIAATKFETMRNWATADGRIHGAFKYRGAATGRWTSFGVQFQNLKKQNGLDAAAAIALVSNGSLAAMRKHYADPLAVVGEVARAAVIAAPGHRLITADFSGIESRALAWLAGEKWKIDQWAKFDQTGDPKDEPYFVTGKGFGFDDDTARNPGKTGDLAFGYVGGLGAWRKFAGDEMPDAEVERLKAGLARRPSQHGQAMGPARPLRSAGGEIAERTLRRVPVCPPGGQCARRSRRYF